MTDGKVDPLPGLTLGIDATNLRDGGGRTHLLELLNHANPHAHGITKVVVWGARSTLALLPASHWLVKRNMSAHEGGLIARSLWQRYEMERQARAEGCHLVLSPGGSHSARFHPVVTMSRNMLPFEWREIRRYGVSLTTLKLLLLRWMQSKSFRSADGVIFLTNYAAQKIQLVTPQLRALTQIIPHGLNARFRVPPKPQQSISEYSPAQPYRLLYVSTVDQYKHQWHVVQAVAELRRRFDWPLALELVGSAYQPALQRLERKVNLCDPGGEWVTYHGAVPYAELHRFYRKADLDVFASSCENMPNILLESMAAGLPIASSDRGPMPELLGDGGFYFDPEKPGDIAQALESMIADPTRRTILAQRSYAKAQQYSWEFCANQTFAFLAAVYQRWEEESFEGAV